MTRHDCQLSLYGIVILVSLLAIVFIDKIEATCIPNAEIVQYPSITASSTAGEYTINDCSNQLAEELVFGKWFQLNEVSESARLTISTCSACFDTTITIYSSLRNDTNCNSLNCFAYNDDNNNCEGLSNCFSYNYLWSSISFCAQKSYSYWIFVSSYNGWSVGDFNLIIEEFGSCTPPSNDQCAGAELITHLPSTVLANITNANGDFNECGGVKEGIHSVWYHIEGNGDYMQVSTCSDQTTFQTSLMVFKGGCNALQCVGSNYEGDCTNQLSSIEWCSVNGTHYWIAVSGVGSQSGEVLLNFTSSDNCQKISNDVCYNRILISTIPSLSSGTTRGSVYYQDNIPSLCSSSYKTGIVWYSLYGTGSSIVVSLCNSSYDTYLSVFKGSCDELLCVEHGDDNCGKQSSFSFCSIAGVEYFIAVGGANQETGDFELSISEGSHCVADSTICEGAIFLEIPSTIFGDTASLIASKEPAFCGATSKKFNTVNIEWYKFIGTGHTLQIATYGSCYDTALVLFSSIHELERACSSLQCLTLNDDASSSYYNAALDSCETAYLYDEYSSNIEFCSEENREYYILVTGYYSSKGKFTLSISSGDDFCVPNISPSSAIITTVGELVDSSDFVYGVFDDIYFCKVLGGFYGIWYAIIGDGNMFQFNYCSESFDPFSVLIYSSSLSSLALDECITGVEGSYSCDSFSWCTKVNTVYWIYVSTFYYYSLPDYPDYYLPQLNFTITSNLNTVCGQPNYNELCIQSKTILFDILLSPIHITGNIFYNGGDKIDSIYIEANDLYFLPPQYTWYSFTGIGHQITISTCRSKFPTKLAVFEDNCDFQSIVATDDNSCSNNLNAITQFCAVTQVTYYLLVAPDSYVTTNSNSSYIIDITVSSTCRTTPCSSGVSTELTIPSSYSISTINQVSYVDVQTVQSIPPECTYELTYIHNTYWYKYTPDEDYFIVISACSKEFELVLSLFTTTNCNLFTCISGTVNPVCGDTMPPIIEHCSTAGQDYYLMIASKNDVKGIVTLHIDEYGECSSNPKIDINCQSTNVITSYPFYVFGHSVFPFVDFNDCNNNVYNNYYYNMFTIVGEGYHISIDGCSTGTLLTIVDDCHSSLSCVMSAEDCAIGFCATPNTEYHIYAITTTQRASDYSLVFLQNSYCIGTPDRPEVFLNYVTTIDASLEWSSPFSYDFPILSYQVVLIFDLYYDFIYYNEDYASNSINFTNLMPNSSYTFYVSATNEWGASYLALLSFTTFEGDCFLPYSDVLSLSSVSSQFQLVGNLITNLQYDIEINSIDFLANINTDAEPVFLLTLYESDSSLYPSKYFKSTNFRTLHSGNYNYDYWNNYWTWTWNDYYNYDYNYYYYYSYDDYYLEDEYFSYWYWYSYNNDDEFPIQASNLNWKLCAGKSYFIGISSTQQTEIFQLNDQSVSSCLGTMTGVSMTSFSIFNQYRREFWLSEDIQTNPFYMKIDANIITHEIDELPAAPIISDHFSSLSSITVIWENSCTDLIQSYRLSITSDDFNFETQVNSSTHSYTFENLASNKDYEVTITSINTNGESDTVSVLTSTLSFEYINTFSKSINEGNDPKSLIFPSEMDTDQFGNTIIFGQFVGSIEFSSTYKTTTPQMETQCFLTSYNNNGDLNWSLDIGIFTVGSYVSCNTVTTDSNGDIYVGGTLMGYVYFSSNFSVTGDFDYNYMLYIAKYSKDGEFLFIKTAKTYTSTSYSCGAESLAVDSEDNLIASGYIFGTVQFVEDSYSFPFQNNSLFIAKWDRFGTLLNTNIFSSYYGWIEYSSIVVDQSDDDSIYLTALYIGYCFIDDFMLYEYTISEIVSKLDADLSIEWITEITASDDLLVKPSIAISDGDFPGSVFTSSEYYYALFYAIMVPGEYFYGYYTRIASIGYETSSYILALDKLGEFKWSSNIATSIKTDFYGNEYPLVTVYDLDVTPSNDLVIVGSYKGTLKTDSEDLQELPNSFLASAFIIIYSQENYTLWASSLGTPYNLQQVRSVSLFGEQLRVSGYFDRTLIIDCSNTLLSSVKNTFLLYYNVTTFSHVSNTTNQHTVQVYNITDYSGTISYPTNNQQSYPNNADIYFYIQPKSAYHIQLNINLFSLSSGDYLEIIDGISSPSNVIKYYTGNNAILDASHIQFYDNYYFDNQLVVRSNEESVIVHLHSDDCYASAGIEIDYISAPKLAHCDNDFPQYFEAQSGIISEDTKGGYKNNANCVYYIQPAYNINYIILDFLQFKVENEDYLAIYDGNEVNSEKLLILYYGNSSISSIQSTQRTVTLQFVSNERNYNSGWSLKYTGVQDLVYCNGEVVLNDRDGSFISQSRSKYSPTSNCTWNINTDLDLDLSKFKTFLYFPTLVISPESELSVTYHSNSKNQVITQTVENSKQLFITEGEISTHFMANMESSNGFEGVYCTQTSNKCETKYYTNITGSIDNHFCGPFYRSDANCEWSIIPNYGDIEYIMLAFSMIDFNNSKSINDYLVVKECSSSSDCKQISKLYESSSYYQNQSLPILITKSPKLQLLFFSDSYNSGEGFDAMYCASTASTSSNCSYSLSNPSGHFNNEFCMGYYGANMSCSWTSTFPKQIGKTVLIFYSIEFAKEEFNTVHGWYDNLYIFDKNENLIVTVNNGGIFYGTKYSPSEQNENGVSVVTPLIFSYDHEVIVKFSSDDKGFADAFNASYCILGEDDSRLCSNNTVYRSSYGVIGNQACDSYYQSNANCLYQIAPTNYNSSSNEILLFFSRIDFKNENNNDPKDFLNVYNGVYPNDFSDSESMIATFNSTLNTQTPIVVQATLEPVYLYFESDDQLFGTGFIVEYCTIQAPAQSCGGLTIESNYSGSFSDHSCGPTYISPLSCSWKIEPQTMNYTYIVLIFSKLDIGVTKASEVIIKDSSSVPLISSYPSYSPNSELFGASIYEGLALYFEEASVLIDFEVKENATLYSGWSIDYYTVNDKGVCKELNVYNESSGTVVDHLYGNYYQNKISCAFLINIANTSSRISVKFNHFDLESGYDFLEVYDGDSWTSDMIGLYSGSELPEPFSSSSSSLYFIFTSDYSVISSGFSFYYSDSNLLECPLYCSNHGECLNGTCICESDRYGEACDIPPPPYIQSSVYTSSLSEIIVSFSRATNRANMFIYNYFGDTKNCSHVLTASTISKLGVNPTCIWSDDQNLIIKLGYRSTLQPNYDSIDILPNVISSNNPTNETPIAGELSSILTIPSITSPPKIMIVGSSTYRAGSSISLDAFGSYIDGGRELVFSWNISTCTYSSSSCSYYSEDCIQCSSVDSRLLTYVTSVTSSKLDIPNFFIRNYGMSSFFRVYANATNFINLTGISHPFDISMIASNLPTVSIMGPTVRSVNRGEILLIRASIDLPSTMKRSVDVNCPDIEFHWKFDDCIPSPCPFNLSSLLTSHSSQLYLDTSDLEYDGEYIIEVSVTLNDNTTQSSRSRVYLSILSMYLELEIEGGDQVVSKGKDVSLNTKILNPPNQSYLDCSPSYRWGCRKSPSSSSSSSSPSSSSTSCILENGDYLEIDDSSNITFSTQLMMPGSYILTSLVKCGDYSAKDEIMLNILRRNQTLLKLYNPQNTQNKHNPSDPLLLIVSSAENPSSALQNIRWSIVSGNLDFNISSSSSSSSSSLSSFLLSESINESQLMIAPNTLDGGSTIRFKVEANREGEEIGSVEIEVSVNDPPSSGILFIDPPIGTVDTEFLFLSDGASDSIDDLPLRYIFGVKPIECLNSMKIGNECPAIAISNILEFPAFSAYLSPGNYTPFVDIIDRSDASTRLYGEEIIEVVTSCATSEVSLLQRMETINSEMIHFVCVGNYDQVRQLFNLANIFISCSSFPIDGDLFYYYNSMNEVMELMDSNMQMTNVLLDNQIKSILLISSSFIQRSVDDDDKKMRILNSIKYASFNGTDVGFLRNDTSGALLNSLSYLLNSTIPLAGISSFSQSLIAIGNSALKQYSCNNIPVSIQSNNLQLSSRKRSISKLGGDVISTNNVDSSSSSSSSFVLPDSFSISGDVLNDDNYYSTDQCVEYHAVDYVINPFLSASSSLLLSQTSELSFTSQNQSISINNLQSPIRIYTPITENIDSLNDAFCGWWDESSNDWKTDGCNLIAKTDDYFILETYHLTSFAVLLGGNSGGGSASPVSVSFPEFDPNFTDASIIFGSSNLNEEGNLVSSFTQFSLIPPSAFPEPLTQALSDVYNAIAHNDHIKNSRETWDIIEILSLTFAGVAVVIFIVSAIILSIPSVRRRANGTTAKMKTLKSQHSKKRGLMSATPPLKNSLNNSITHEDQEEYWNN